jgi:hypothetical protein
MNCDLPHIPQSKNMFKIPDMNLFDTIIDLPAAYQQSVVLHLGKMREDPT